MCTLCQSVVHITVLCTPRTQNLKPYFTLRDANKLRHIFLSKICFHFKKCLTKGIQNVIYCFALAPMLLEIICYLQIMYKGLSSPLKYNYLDISMMCQVQRHQRPPCHFFKFQVPSRNCSCFLFCGLVPKVILLVK